MSLLSQWRSSAQQQPHTASKNSAKLAKNQLVHDWCIVTPSQPISAISDAKIHQIRFEFPAKTNLGIDALVDFVQDDRHGRHDGGPEGGRVTARAFHNHGATIGQGMRIGVANTNT